MRIMKKLFLLLLLLFATNSFAQLDYAEHSLVVHRLSYWAPDYLTVTNNWNNMYFPQAPSTLKSLSVITEINGQSTKDMEPEDFYAIIDRVTSFDITYMTKIRGENKTYSCQLCPKKGKLLYGNNSGVTYHGSNGYISSQWPENSDENWFYTYKDEEKYIDNTWYGNWEKTRKIGPTPIESTTIMADQYADLFQFNTFDYIVAGDDYMTDLGLVQNYAKELEKKGLKYNPEKPDIYLYITKDSRSSIESIYVPNLISTTRSSSSTGGNIHIYYGNYNTWGNSSSNTTGISTTNTHDLGHTKAFVDADLFLQFAILDAKRMDKPNPPVVWQLIHKRHFTDQTNIIEWAKKLHIALYSYPTPIKEIGRQIETWGILFQDKLSKSGKICDVAENSWASQYKLSGKVLKKTTFNRRNNFSIGKGKEPYNDLFILSDKLLVNNRTISIKSQQDLNFQFYYIPETEFK